MRISNWGNYPVVDADVLRPGSDSEAAGLVRNNPSLIARGQGRCYGDSSLHASCMLGTERLDRMLSFDDDMGLLTAESGLTLREIINVFVPRGWFVPVTPGTAHISLGGAVAADVHGKNHHAAGSFARHVEWIDILTAEKGVVRCSTTNEPELFRATCGGHGLTGIILRVALRLCRIPSAWIKQTTVKAANLAEIMESFEEYSAAPFSVAWIDCLQKGGALGRSILMFGDFCPRGELPGNENPLLLKQRRLFAVPFNAPSLALTPVSVKAFNAFYYARFPKGKNHSLVPYTGFFYPLDALLHWNRIYGKRGFIQYQFVLPVEASAKGLPAVLRRIANAGLGSFLAVLKLFGKQESAPGNMSFPVKGYTLALDFPISRNLFPLLDELDRIVLDHGGRHYLSKDARLSAKIFAQSYGKTLEDFLAVKSKWDPENKFTSSQAMRLRIRV